MPLPIQITLNAVLMIILGIVLLAGGVYMAFDPYMRMMAFGLLFTGLGCVFCGLSDGFSDPTPRGLMFRKFGYTAFVLGLPVLIYTGYYML